MQTVAICDTGSLMNSNRENIVLNSINYCLHFEGRPRGSPGPPPLLDEVIFNSQLAQNDGLVKKAKQLTNYAKN